MNEEEVRARFDAFDARFVIAAARQDRIEADVKLNTALTIEVHDVIVACKAGFKVLGYIGTGIKWLGAVGAAVVSIYAAVQLFMHGPPK